MLIIPFVCVPDGSAQFRPQHLLAKLLFLLNLQGFAHTFGTKKRSAVPKPRSPHYHLSHTCNYNMILVANCSFCYSDISSHNSHLLNNSQPTRFVYYNTHLKIEQEFFRKRKPPIVLGVSVIKKVRSWIKVLFFKVRLQSIVFRSNVITKVKMNNNNN